MLYPRLAEAIIEVKTLDCICHINTNGSLMDLEWEEFFVTVGLDSIKFSFQGVTKKGYEYMRNSSQFHRILNNIKSYIRQREIVERKLPLIQIEKPSQMSRN